MECKKKFAVMCLILTFLNCFGVNAMEESQNGDSNRPRQVLLITDMPKEEVLPQVNGVLNRGTSNEAPALFARKSGNKSNESIASIFLIEEIFDGKAIKSEYDGVLRYYANSADNIIFWLKDEDKETNNKFCKAAKIFLKSLETPTYNGFFLIRFTELDCNTSKSRCDELLEKTEMKFRWGWGWKCLQYVVTRRFYKFGKRQVLETSWAEKYISYRDSISRDAKADKKNCNTKLLGIGIPVALVAVVGIAFGGIKCGEHMKKNKVPKVKSINKTLAKTAAVA